MTRVASLWVVRHDDGPSIGWENAKVACDRCDGFAGLECPVEGCTVRLVSTQKEDDERLRRKHVERDKRRRKEQDKRRARRAT